MLHEYFDHTYLINLDRRPDRLFTATNKCKEIGLVFERFPACDGAKENLVIPTAKEVGQPECYWNLASAGLSVSLKRIITDAKEKGYDSILILEDDIEFHPMINQIVKESFKYIPEDWEMIYFGANHAKPFSKVSKNIIRLGGAYTTHCHALKSSIYDIVLNELEKLNNPIDVLYSELIHSRNNSYGFSPNVAYQSVGYSDIVKNVVNYNFLKK